MFTCSMVNLNHQDLRSDSSNWSSLFQAQDRGGPSEDLKTCSSYVKMQNYYLIYSNMCFYTNKLKIHAFGMATFKKIFTMRRSRFDKKGLPIQTHFVWLVCYQWMENGKHKLRRLGVPNQIVGDSNLEFHKFGRQLWYKSDSNLTIKLTIAIPV